MFSCEYGVCTLQWFYRAVYHKLKTFYFRWLACNYCVVRLPRFMMHINSDPEIDYNHDRQFPLLSGQLMFTRFFKCKVPQCDFLTNAKYALNHHMIMYHKSIDDFTRALEIYDVEQLVPIRQMPRSFIDIMEIHCARTLKMIGKFFGACQTVVLFLDYVLPKLYSVVQGGNSVGLFKFMLHPSLCT